MKTLIEIAKRLGIRPNPKMNDMLYYQEHYLRPMLKEIDRIFGKGQSV